MQIMWFGLVGTPQHGSCLMRAFLIFVFLASPCFGQAWSGVLAPSRAINWSNAGLPATLPDGETTTNPWTPPTRAQCTTSACNTVSGGTVTASSINAALVSAPSGTYVLIPPGNYTISSANITLYAANGGDSTAQTTGRGGVTLRGSGPQSTTLTLNGTSTIQFGVSWSTHTCTWSSGFSVGTTSITVTGCTATPISGQLIFVSQCDTGYSGSGCTTGTSEDNGGLYICGTNPACQVHGEGTGGPQNHQVQAVYVASVTGSGPYTINFTPGLHMPNWSRTRSPFIRWTTSSAAGNRPISSGLGLEDLTIHASNSTANFAVAEGPTYASWVKGVRFLGETVLSALQLSSSKNCLVMNNYFFTALSLNNLYPAAMEQTHGSDNLVLNNISASSVPWEGMGSNTGNVYAYNYGRDTFTAYYENNLFDHAAGSAFWLFEGNEVGITTDDATHGTDHLNTWFRNFVSGWDAPYSTINPRGMQFDAFHRFDNAIGNVIGNKSSAAPVNAYEVTSNWNGAFQFGQHCCGGDSLVATTAMRWGNVTTIQQSTDTPANSGVRFVSSEVPASLVNAIASFSNPVPSNTDLPCSFYFAAYAASPCNIRMNGGTGFNWWRVCKTWTNFPTSCSTTQTQPFPPIGPDQSRGVYVSGYAYDIPAYVAWQNLPIDSTYQNSYTITSSSWSSGTETLTVSGLPTGNCGGSAPCHLMGGFQTSGVNAACIPSGAVNGEILMTNSSNTTVSYALSSNPGVNCTGTMKFPDVRQFDERVYLLDRDPTPGIQPPTNLTAIIN